MAANDGEAVVSQQGGLKNSGHEVASAVATRCTGIMQKSQKRRP
jgi:hypothetical protein